MSSARSLYPRYTVEDYRHWLGDWELWDGIAIAMSPSPFGRHQAVQSRLLVAIAIAIEAANCDAIVLADLDWIINRQTVVRPDLVLVCGEPPEQYLEKPPALVAEILSPSTSANDRGFKRDLYRQEGVEHLLLVDPVAKSIELEHLQSPGSRLEPAPDVLELSVCEDCSLTIPLAGLFGG